MSSSKEPVCQRIQELRSRLERLKKSCRSAITSGESAKRHSFSQDWQEGWRRIVGLRAQIDQVLNRSRKGWDNSQPAILRFPAVEQDPAPMGAF